MTSTMEEEPTYSSVVESSPTIAIDVILAGHADCEELKDLVNKDNATQVVAVSRGKERSSSAAAAKCKTVDMDAKLTVSTGRDECQKLKNLMNKKYASIIVVATVSSKTQQASEAKPSLTSSQLCFLAAASNGDPEVLTCHLSRTGDVEEGNNVAAPSAASLLESVTTEGDTALHLMAANGAYGDQEEFERCAKLLHQEDKDKRLLSKTNKKGDTPLHCAARAGNSQLLSYLIDLAKDDGKMQDLLRMTNNNNETALHEAVRSGDNNLVNNLLSEDPELAFFPRNGTSPLYLAILLKEDNLLTSMAQTLYNESGGSLSYLGSNGQNALHAAVMQGSELTGKLLQWNKDLTIQRDENGSTPLHFAAGLPRAYRRGSVCSQVFNANSDALYQLDNDGLSPIHVAASVDAYSVVALFINKCPGSAGLRDARGRTFLHVAVENKQVVTVSACMNRSQQAWILNMQDNDGNTALHLAVKAGSLRLFCALFANPKVHLNITNAKGQTPLDIAQTKVPRAELFYSQNSEIHILCALERAGAKRGASRRDHFNKSRQEKAEHESKQLEKLKDLTQTQSITSVVIATVAFGATFALPGGYRADDHTNGGTPTLAGRYAFDAFMMANALAFVFSAAAIVCISCGGSPVFNYQSRIIYLLITLVLMRVSVTCFTAAFALGVFAVLSPVAHKTAVVICYMSPLVVLCNNAEFWVKWLILAPSYSVRKGRVWTVCCYIWLVVWNLFIEFWPFLLIFIWAAYGRTHPMSKVELPAQPPSSV